MRPHRLVVSAFLAYGDQIEVDFDALSEGGLFLIQGETGAGKTALLDAMAFAIYGRLPGARGELTSALRSQHAAAATPTFVELEASVGGSRIRIRRNPEYQRPKARGTGETAQKAHVAVSVFTKGEWEPLSASHVEVANFLRDWIGLDAEQFFKLVLLPQGDFAAFLEASSSQRSAILSKLFADELRVFQRVQDWFKREQDAADSALQEADQELRIQRERIAQVLSGSEVSAGDVEDVEWIDARLAEQTVLAEESVAQRKQAERLMQEAVKAHAEGQQRIEASTKYREAKTRVDYAERNLATFREQHATLVDPAWSPTDAARRLEELEQQSQRALDEAESRNASFLRIAVTRKELREAVAQATTLSETIAAAATAREERAQQRSALTKLVSEGTQAGTQLREAALATGLLSSRVQLATARDSQIAALDKAEHSTTASAETLRVRADAVEAARNALLVAQAADLAANLQSGAPCPVCGSTHHPQPTIHSAGGDRSQVDAAERAWATAQTSHAAAAAAREVAATMVADYREQLGDAADALVADLRVAEGKARTTSEALDAAVQRSSTAAQTLQDLEGIEAKANAQWSALDEQRTRQDAALAAMRSQLLELASQAGIGVDAELPVIDSGALTRERDERSRLRSQLATLLDDVTSARGALSAFAAVESGELPNLTDLEMARGQAEVAFAGSSAAADAVATLIEELRSRRTHFVNGFSALVQTTSVRERIAAVAGPINGRGTNKTLLVSYYLAARLRQVIERANERLARMTSGRYTFVFDEDARGRGYQSLEIAVHDAWNGGQRPVKTLSGGETFTASLALALGLADIVESEAGGRTLDSLFVDEGFGTLSPEYLNRVMDDLDVLRASGRFIGIISHVTELRQRIPMQLEVVKSNTGSTVRMTDLEG